MKKSLSRMALMMAGLTAAVMPSMPVANNQSPALERAAPQANRVPVSQAPVARYALMNMSIADIALIGSAPFQRSQFYLGVPRYRGHRNGRPRGRRSYRAIHR